MENVKPRILHVTKRYPPYIGGTEALCHDVCSALKNDYDQIVLAFNDKRTTIQERYEDIEVIRVGVFLTIASQPICFGYRQKIVSLLEEFKPDIIHFDYPNPFAAFHLLKAIKKTKWNGKFLLFWIMDIIKQRIIRVFFKKQTISLINKADMVQILSPRYLEGTSFLPFYQKRYRVLSPRVGDYRLIINDNQKMKINEIKKQNNGKTICFFFGRHVKYKGLEYLISSNQYLDKNKIIIYIGGEGPLTNKLKKKSKKYNNIIFLGKMSNDDVNAYLQACDIFLFPSITRNEAFGISLAEAMWFGKPSVTFTIPGSGVNWVSINNKTGLEVENRNSLEYAKAITRLTNDNNLYQELSKNAFERAHSLFSLERFEKCAIDEYNEILFDKKK